MDRKRSTVQIGLKNQDKLIKEREQTKESKSSIAQKIRADPDKNQQLNRLSRKEEKKQRQTM